jgi:hypothetical protein
MRGLMGASSSYEAQIQESFSAFSAILRLSTKYEVAPLRWRAISVIAQLYPTTLAEFKQRNVVHDKLPSWDFDGRAFAVLALAEECRVSSLIPSALYCV